MSTPFIESSLTKEDRGFEQPLRPQSLEDFRGQESICERLQVMVGAAKQRGETLDHCLFCGPPGLGKTTLANILAKAMGTNITTTSGPAVEKAGDLAGLLTNLQEGDIFFIDELHRLNKTIEEYLYRAMEDFCLDIMIDSGPGARSVQVQLNKFTLAGATTRVGLLTAPLRSRFGFSCRLNYYTPEILKGIIRRSAKLLGVEISDDAALEIGSRSRGTPRIANNLLRWVRDFAQMRANNIINYETAANAIGMLDIDKLGLDEMDRKILEVLIDNYNGGPAGIGTIAVAVGEEQGTLEEVHEPYLILLGLLKRTPRGREATAQAYKHLNRIKQGDLL